MKIGVEEAVFEFHGAAVIGAHRLAVAGMLIEQAFQPRRQSLEARVGIGLHPFSIERCDLAFGERLAKPGIEVCQTIRCWLLTRLHISQALEFC